MATLSTSLIIPNYNGKVLLERNLPLVLAAAERQGGTEVLLVDDGSTDGSPAAAAQFKERIQVLRQPVQRGFGQAVNLGVEEARGEVVVLLNSDVAVEPDFLAPLLDAMDSHTLAVTACSLTEDGRNEALSRAFFEDGDLVVVQPGIELTESRNDRPCTNFHASGGFSAFNREKFLLLGGFDPIYHPFYWEDVDLCFRAWKRGWRVVYEPASRVHHLPHSTISQHFTPAQVRRIYEANKHTFILKNITEEQLLAQYIRRLSSELFRRPETPGEAQRYWGAFEAIKRSRAALARRSIVRRQQVLSDSEVFSISANIPC